MSTELRPLTAMLELQGKTLESEYKEKKVLLTRFSGSTRRGACLQLSFNNQDGDNQHIQLDNTSVKELIAILQEAYL